MTEHKAEFHGAALIVKDAGEFDADDGRHIKYEKFIKIQVGTNFIKISALQLAGLVHATQDKEIKAELMTRFREEKAALESIEGF